MTTKKSNKAEVEEVESFDIEALAAPQYSVYYPKDTWSEILPGLHLGGTDGFDDMRHAETVTGGAAERKATITKGNFDTVVTLYAWAKPADWWVKELRFGFYDGDMSDFHPDQLVELVRLAHSDWKSGKRVLIRCQAGLNRSGLVMALLLMHEGLEAIEAIDLMRTKRGEAVLCNFDFADWLLELSPAALKKLMGSSRICHASRVQH